MDNLETEPRPTLSFSDAKEQNQILRTAKLSRRFSEALSANGLLPLAATPIETMQVNVGKICNMTCTHCHVDAGPERQESMPDKVVDRILEIFTTSSIANFDITGGAPELHPRFREIIQRVALPGRKVIHRCNLTAIMSKSLEDIPALLAQYKVEIVASLPCYTMANYDKQRGDGSFVTAIKALRHLNDLGYGKKDSELILNLVYNPSGALLPGNEAEIQAQYKQELKTNFDIVFNNLFALTNLPLGRFLDSLLKEGQLESYMTLLVN
ncbi:MAG: DUF3641 domain-containing protein, partial [Candidatus Electrothrix sp. AR3]|nr:DUF3641 domain-containing protein [Candidatus Electrothrix sp. AR3]